MPPRPAAADDPTPSPGRPSGRKPTWHGRLRSSRRPARIRLLAFAAALATVGLVWLVAVEVSQERAGLHAIGDQAGPVVVASSDLYFALNDMDAQVANVLLVGEQNNLGISRTQALDIYEQRRTQVSRDVRQAAAAASDAATQQSIEEVLNSLGRYEEFAARTILLDQQTSHPAGRPTAATLAQYRQATDLLKTQLLPAVSRLTDQHAAALEGIYQSQQTRIGTVRVAIAGLGLILLALLLALQVYLAHHFRRLLSPALAAATLLAALGIMMSIGLVSTESTHLRVAKKDAFTSILALTQARAVSYDANADESRYLVDPERAGQYQQAFLTKSQQLVELPGATLDTWDQRLDETIQAYQRSNADVGWGGLFGAEFRNITFVGERAEAENALRRYQVYQVDDRRIRALAASGDLAGAIAFCTSYAPGDSNYAFDQYDQALAALIAINQRAFDQAIGDATSDLGGWTVALWAGCAVMVALLFAGVWPRLAEYR